MHDASGGFAGDDDAERAGGIVQAEDALVDPRVDETIIVVPGHFLFAKAAAAGSMRLARCHVGLRTRVGVGLCVIGTFAYPLGLRGLLKQIKLWRSSIVGAYFLGGPFVRF